MSQQILRLYVAADSRETLCEFFELTYLPEVLEEKSASASTVKLYRDSLAWWRMATGDPPLESLDRETLKLFRDELQRATFRRGPGGKLHALRPFSIAKHMRQIDFLLADCARRKTMPSIPRLIVPRPRLRRPKPSFELSLARATALAAAESHWYSSRRAKNPPRCAAGLWGLAILATLYYSGLRSGTVLDLQWRMLCRRRDGCWWDVPAEAIPKTHKPLEKFVHPQNVELLDRLHSQLVPRPSPLENIFDWRRSYSHFSDVHDRWQAAAGIPPEEWLSPQAWRRTHDTQLGLLGLPRAQEIARQALDHASVETTKEFYCDLEPHFIRSLPLLIEKQLSLF